MNCVSSDMTWDKYCPWYTLSLSTYWLIKAESYILEKSQLHPCFWVTCSESVIYNRVCTTKTHKVYKKAERRKQNKLYSGIHLEL